jgi:HK97 family phage major capsid protein
MARESFGTGGTLGWIAVQSGDVAIQALMQYSATERLARPEPMATDTKQVPRSGDFAISSVAKGGGYTETAGTQDYVQLIARKAGGVLRVAEEDLTDAGPDILATKRVGAARNMAKFYDNGTLGVSAAENGTTVPWTSVYKALRTTNSASGGFQYTADANYVAFNRTTTASGALGYTVLSNAIGIYEESDFFDESQGFIIASPAWKAGLRNVVDTMGRPIFNEGPIIDGIPQDMLFGYRVTWSQAAKVSAVATHNPAGNPLLVIGNRDFLIKGMANLSPEIASPNPGFAIQRARAGIGFLTDEALMKAAMRRGFVLGTEKAFVVVERTA